MKPNLILKWKLGVSRIGVALGLYWGYVGVLLGLYWGLKRIGVFHTNLRFTSWLGESHKLALEVIKVGASEKLFGGKWGFPKIRGIFFRGPNIQDYSILRSKSGSPLFSETAK